MTMAITFVSFKSDNAINLCNSIQDAVLLLIYNLGQG